MATIAVKNVNEDLYRKVKALAALRGSTMGEVVNQALALWLQLAGKGVAIDPWLRLEELARPNNEAYLREKERLISEHDGEYVVIAGGSVQGTYKDAKEAYLRSRGAGVGHALVTLIRKRPQKVVDLGWSLIEQLA